MAESPRHEYQREAPLEEQELRGLLVRARQGDRAAEQRVLASCARILGQVISKYRAWGDDDMEQEATLGIWRAVHRFPLDSESRFYSYAFACAENHIRKELKNRCGVRNRQVYLEDFAPADSLQEDPIESCPLMGPTGDPSETIDRIVLQDAIRGTPERYQRVLDLRFRQDLPLEQVATGCGMSGKGSGHRMVQRALDCLRGNDGIREAFA